MSRCLRVGTMLVFLFFLVFGFCHFFLWGVVSDKRVTYLVKST